MGQHLIFGIAPTPQCRRNPKERIDCFPGPGPDINGCQNRECCWSPYQYANSTNTPFCFFPRNINPYYRLSMPESSNNDNMLNKGGKNYFMIKTRETPYPKNVDKVKIEQFYGNTESYRLIIDDFGGNNSRYRADIDEVFERKPLKEGLLSVEIDYIKQLITYKRKSTKNVLFELDLNTLIFSDQFIQINLLLKSSYLFGIGEEETLLRRDLTDWTHVTLLGSDHAPEPGKVVYGSQPFFLSIEEDGNAYGVFLLNSNPMEVIFQPNPAISFRTIGGIIDLTVFAGPTPDSVIQQLTDMIGKPIMPPYWALGFHLCRYGYNTLDNMNKTLQRNLNAGIPVDIQWTDIDAMEENKDFTYDSHRFNGLPNFVRELRQKGIHYMAHMDPFIKYYDKLNDVNYKPYLEGLDANVFIKHDSPIPNINSNKSIYVVGMMWPGESVYVDFTHPNSTDYWYNQYVHMANNSNGNGIILDGYWNDMNDPANFVDGSVVGCSKTNNHFNNPPLPPVSNGNFLNYHTICLNSKQYLSSHYNLHNMYGYHEAKVNYNVSLKLSPKKRPYIISRSNFVGMGKYAGHWSGDVWSSFYAMARTIPNMLAFNLFGIPMIGSDICGFNGQTTPELCTRWLQLGSFYPFARSHNTMYASDQDPASYQHTFPLLIESTKRALTIRYTLLPYLYTLFYKASQTGSAVVRPLFYDYPNDKMTYDIEFQFTWGACLMITPVVEEKSTILHTYFPKGLSKWYDFYTGKNMGDSSDSDWNYLDVNAPLDKINLFIKTGCAIPMQKFAMNTQASRKNAFSLLVALDENQEATGDLYIDNGETLELEKIKNKFGPYCFFKFAVTSNKLSLEIGEKHGNPFNNHNISSQLSNVTILGIPNKPSNVQFRIKDQPSVKELPFRYNLDNKVLYVEKMESNLHEPFSIEWII